MTPRILESGVFYSDNLTRKCVLKGNLLCGIFVLQRSDALIRRRLFAYTAMLVGGITAAYVCWERTEVLAGVVFLCSVTLIAARADIYEDITRSERIKLTACVFAGFLMFTFAFMDMNNNLEAQAECSVRGVVRSVRVKENGYEFVILCDRREPSRRVLINCYTDGYRPVELDVDDIYSLIGRKIEAYGSLKIPSGQDNPGTFNYKLYLNSRGIKYSLTAYTFSVYEDTGIFCRIHSYIMRARYEFEDSFKEDDIRALVKGVIFGDKGEIDEEVKSEFNENGTGHILAVSGLHIGFLFSLLWMLTKKRRTFSVSLGIVLILFLYGEMTMWSPSTVRAFIVMTVSLLSTRLRRRADLLTSVSMAAWVLLLSNPYQLFNTGFQMSFAAMLGIAFLTEPLSIFVGEYLALMLAVQLAVAPYTAFVFHRFNPVSIFINVPIVFLGSVIVPVCMLGIGLIIIIGYIPTLYCEIICGLMELLLKLNHLLNSNGEWSFYMTAVNAGVLILFYLIMFLLSSEWTRVMFIRKDYHKIRKALRLVAIPGLLLCLATYNTFSDDEVVFVSVGQGDCTHIRYRDYDLLIDGGGELDRNIGEQILLPYMLANGASDVDNAFLTHLHTDHYKGIAELSKIYEVKEISLSDAYRRSYDNPYARVKFVKASYRYKMADDCYIMPVWPVHTVSHEMVDADEANEFNMVYIVCIKGRKIMVTGDLLEEDEADMLQYYSGTDVLDCDVLKVAHHGSKSSSSEAFLDAVDPDIAVISVGANNMYGHPHAQTVERLEQKGIEIYRTDINGAVGLDITSRGTIRVDLMKPYPLHEQEG